MAKIQNLDRLKRRMKRLRDGPKQAMSGAIQENAEELSGAVRRVTPKGATGELARSVGWSWGNPPQYHRVAVMGSNRNEAAGILGAEKLAATVHVGNDKAWYARLVEFGTRPHANKGLFEGTMHPGTSPNPFFFPTYRLFKKRMLARFGRAMRKSIKTAVNGL
ncbi:HK97-gp10 family putative phage morphogenesis protein [Inquilinus sp. CA228]|uniref:HK97-gp10 family putative phage morphogenesis protein n=1 Tax=Inquilinus sp. CA228 TaxID=3455609 RepID=UPI003F8D7C6F